MGVAAFPRSRLLALRWPPTPVIPEAEGAARGYPGPRAPSDTLFERALAHVLEMEGGYAEDPHDPGGPTNFGITLATYAREKGLVLDTRKPRPARTELKAIPRATVRRIYRERYWLAASCPELPAPLALFHFDAAVNHGPAGAARMLQEAVGAAPDGEIGQETLAKAASQPVARSLARYADSRRRQYRSLATFWRFGKGWLARVERTLAAADAVATPPALTRPLQQQEKDLMAEATNATDAPAEALGTPAKWWGHSMTIWGALITGLSTVLPDRRPAHRHRHRARSGAAAGEPGDPCDPGGRRPRRHNLDDLWPHARHNHAGTPPDQADDVNVCGPSRPGPPPCIIVDGRGQPCGPAPTQAGA